MEKKTPLSATPYNLLDASHGLKPMSQVKPALVDGMFRLKWFTIVKARRGPGQDFLNMADASLLREDVTMIGKIPAAFLQVAAAFPSLLRRAIVPEARSRLCMCLTHRNSVVRITVTAPIPIGRITAVRVGHSHCVSDKVRMGFSPMCN